MWIRHYQTGADSSPGKAATRVPTEANSAELGDPVGDDGQQLVDQQAAKNSTRSLSGAPTTAKGARNAPIWRLQHNLRSSPCPEDTSSQPPSKADTSLQPPSDKPQAGLNRYPPNSGRSVGNIADA